MTADKSIMIFRHRFAAEDEVAKLKDGYIVRMYPDPLLQTVYGKDWIEDRRWAVMVGNKYLRRDGTVE